MDKQELEKIYNGLRRFRGSQITLAERQGCTTEWVRQVLGGKADDADLVVAAAALWNELEQEAAQKKALVQQFVQQAEGLASRAY